MIDVTLEKVQPLVWSNPQKLVDDLNRELQKLQRNEELLREKAEEA